jgi:hypothetical protein
VRSRVKIDVHRAVRDLPARAASRRDWMRGWVGLLRYTR